MSWLDFTSSSSLFSGGNSSHLVKYVPQVFHSGDGKEAEDKTFLETFQPGGETQTTRGKTCSVVGEKVGGAVGGSIWGPIGKFAGSVIGADFGGDLGDFTKGDWRKKLDLKSNFETFWEALEEGPIGLDSFENSAVSMTASSSETGTSKSDEMGSFAADVASQIDWGSVIKSFWG